MAKYDPLRSELRQRDSGRIRMRFDEIAALVGGLPRSAYIYPAWWSNERGGRHVQAHSWIEAGFEAVAVDLARRCVTFARRP